MSALPSHPMRAIHLTAAWAFAVSQPVFSMLLGNPEFLVVRGASRVEVVAFALSLTLIPPLAAVLCTVLVSFVSRRLAGILYLAVLGALVVALVAQILKRVGYESRAILLIAVAVAIALVTAYARWASARFLLSVASCLPVVGVVLFVARAPFVTDDVAAAKVGVTAKTPVVLLVFDEFPVSSLMTASGQLDAGRYPNFARLSREATWYRRATTVHENTMQAVPAILTGRLPQEGELPTLAHHPNNLFTLLGETYRFKVSEHVTYLCPARYCPRDRDPFLARMDGLYADVAVAYSHRVLPEPMASRLPDVPAAGMRRDASVAAFLSGITGIESNTLYFLHTLYPHFPWRQVRSGRDTGAALGNFGLDEKLNWTEEPWVVQQAYQRHLLQLGYTDKLLGRLLQRLERAGLYDRALVIVTADHGVTFAPGRNARAVTPENVADIASVPLFIKFPGQRKIGIDDRAVRTVDILPTVADVLEAEVPWTMHGHSLLGIWREPMTTSVATEEGPIVEVSRHRVRELLRRTLARKAVLGRSWDSLLWAGRGRGLRGVYVDSLHVANTDNVSVAFDFAERVADLDISSNFVPAWISGSIEGADMTRKELVVAVNGRVLGAAGTIHLNDRQRFSGLVPEAAFRDGSNLVELLAVERDGRIVRLIRLGESGTPLTE